MAEKKFECSRCHAQVQVPSKPLISPKTPAPLAGDAAPSKFARIVFFLGTLSIGIPALGFMFVILGAIKQRDGLVLGMASLLGFVAAILGAVKFHQVKSGVESEDPTGLLKVGFWLGIVGACLFIVVVILALTSGPSDHTPPPPTYSPYRRW